MPRVVFITADQFRGDCLSALGHPVVRTPNLDSLAAEGVCFAHNFAQAAPCGPSRACMHTSSYLSDNGSWRNGTPIAAGFSNWAQACAGAGFPPVLFGYTHTARAANETGLDRGFEGILPGLRVEAEFRNDLEDWHRWMQQARRVAPHSPFQLLEVAPGTGGQAGPIKWGAAHYDADACDASYLIDRAVAYLQHRSSRDAVVHISIFSPHDPYLVPRGWPIRRSTTAATTKGYPTRTEEAEAHPFIGWMLQSALGYVGAGEQLVDMRDHYFARIEALDRALGRLLDALRSLPGWDDTLVIFTSDHGDQLGDHHLVGKGGVFDESYHVPLIVRAPAGACAHAPGTVVRQITQTIDIAPTILEFLGVAAPLSFRGRSLLGVASSPPRPAIFEYDFSAAAKDIPELRGRSLLLKAIRDERWTYVEFSGAFEPLLLDNAAPAEAFCNLWGTPEGRALAASLTAAAHRGSQ